MGLKPTFTKAQIAKHIKARVDQFRQAVTDRLKYAGEEFVNLARQVDSYKDDTGNLRSSIGYMILFNGRNIAESFPGDKPEGKKQGKKVAKEILKAYPAGYILVGVAGMDYAAAVEAKGYDVLNTTSEKVEELLKNSLQRMRRNFNG